MAIRDFLREGLDSGWRVTDASRLQENEQLETDVVVVGTGAGGATAAEVLQAAGLDVILVEEGTFRTSADFRMEEVEAFRWQFQEGALRRTASGDINLLQGHMAGGSTAVSWGTMYDPPAQTLEYWRDQREVLALNPDVLAPVLAQVRARLHVAKWTTRRNENNDILREGCRRLGWNWRDMERAVRGCWNLGYCSMGCPTNAMQSTLTTSLPALLRKGVRLYTRLRCERLAHRGDQVTEMLCQAQESRGVFDTGVQVRIRARHFVLAAGGIGTPGILLRSAVPDPYKRIGRRTFLHPVVISRAVFEQQVDPYHGAPQSAQCDHFLFPRGATGPMGFRIEAVPLHPVLWAGTLPAVGEQHARWMSELPHTNCLAALLRDGFDPGSQGGHVWLDDFQHAHLSYPITDYTWDGVRRAWLAMAEIQFAAGARSVMPVHADARPYTRYSEARLAISTLEPDAPRTRFASAHVMGGCAMGNDPRHAVTNSRGRFHHLQNLSVLDGSLFPTGLGASPQLTVTAIALHLADQLAAELSPALS